MAFTACSSQLATSITTVNHTSHLLHIILTHESVRAARAVQPEKHKSSSLPPTFFYPPTLIFSLGNSPMQVSARCAKVSSRRYVPLSASSRRVASGAYRGCATSIVPWPLRPIAQGFFFFFMFSFRLPIPLSPLNPISISTINCFLPLHVADGTRHVIPTALVTGAIP